MGVFAEFVLSAAASKQFPTDLLPEVGLVGRSNVGKSSLINSLLQMSKLARTSNTPGRTQTLNFYRVWPEGKPRFGAPELPPDDTDRFSLRGSALEAAQAAGAFYFVDMPGYGYAKVSVSQRKAWSKLIEGYLQQRTNLKGVIQLVDVRHPPTADDKNMWEWLGYHGLHRVCVATKADKISRTHRPRHLKQVAQDLVTAEGQLILYSAEDGTGREQLWDWVLETTKR